MFCEFSGQIRTSKFHFYLSFITTLRREAEMAICSFLYVALFIETRAADF